MGCGLVGCQIQNRFKSKSDRRKRFYICSLNLQLIYRLQKKYHIPIFQNNINIDRVIKKTTIFFINRWITFYNHPINTSQSITLRLSSHLFTPSKFIVELAFYSLKTDIRSLWAIVTGILLLCSVSHLFLEFFCMTGQIDRIYIHICMCRLFFIYIFYDNLVYYFILNFSYFLRKKL